MPRKNIVLVAFVLICLIAWPTYFRPARERASIRRVLAAEHEVQKNLKMTWGDYLTFDEGRIPTEAVEGLRKIDLTDCPDDFREAYLRYIATLDAVADACRDASGLRPIKKLLLREPPGKTPYEALEAAKLAEREVHLSAQRHGVSY